MAVIVSNKSINITINYSIILYITNNNKHTHTYIHILTSFHSNDVYECVYIYS
jgi:hypothetical protein